MKHAQHGHHGRASIIDHLFLYVLAGLLADGLIKRGVSVTQVRKRLQTVAFLGPAVALVILSRSKDPRVAVACMTCALGITSLGDSSRGSLHHHQPTLACICVHVPPEVGIQIH